MSIFQNAIEPTSPDPLMKQSTAYFSSKLAIIETSLLFSGECACDPFSFLIPLRSTPAINTYGKFCKLNARSVFPCNPMQPHRVIDSGINDFKAYVLYMDDKLLSETTEILFNCAKLEFNNSCFNFSNALKYLIYTFIKEFCMRQPGYDLLLQSLSIQAAVIILRGSYHNLSNRYFEPKEYRDDTRIKRAIDYLIDNYQGKISLNDLADETNYSPYHFLRLFKNHTGKTPFEYLMDIKIEKAKSLLRDTDYTITHVCDLSGFNSCSYFTQAFKKKTGVTPTQYKNCI